jgi:hypothetical protein
MTAMRVMRLPPASTVELDSSFDHLSARASSVSGTSRPRALAVLKFGEQRCSRLPASCSFAPSVHRTRPIGCV